MSNLKKTHDLIRQNEKIVKKPQKHDANLQKNSTIYFQVGLIVCLLMAYGLFEMKFETIIPEVHTPIPMDEPVYADVILIKPKEPIFEEPIKQKKAKISIENLEIVPDISSLDPLKKEFIETKESLPDLNSNNIILEKLPLEPVDVDFINVEQVPIYPGCEKKKNNFERKKCMSDKINKLVLHKFNGGLASDYGLSGIQKIRVNFKIDKNGEVTDIETYAPHPKLEAEAERVISKIPKMKPGMQHDKPVGVIYTLPIVFQVE
jgi:protein TonB